MAGATVIGQVDAVAQSSVQQHLAAARQKAMAIDSDLVTSCHCLIPEGFNSPSGLGDPPSMRSWDAHQTKRIRRKEGDKPARECFICRVDMAGTDDIDAFVASSIVRSAQLSDSCTFEKTHEQRITAIHDQMIPLRLFQITNL